MAEETHNFALRSGQMCRLLGFVLCLSCTPRSTPVSRERLLGKWQGVDKPAISMTFTTGQAFCAYVAGQRLLGGTYRLLNGEQLVWDLDAASPKTGLVTNRVFMLGEELRIVSADGKTERYRRVEERQQ